MTTISRRDLLVFDYAGQVPDGNHWIRVHRTAMACRFEIALSGEDAAHVVHAREALDEADRIEAALTLFRDTSELVRVNREAAHGAVATDATLFGLLCRCRDLHAATDGTFDITSTPLSRCWGFLQRNGRLPAADEIDAARARVGMQDVRLEPVGRTVQFGRPGMELNLGSIGKGYALDRMARLLERSGVRHALLSAGASSVLALGGRRRGWPVDLHSKQVARDRFARLHLRAAAMSTSGAGEQFVEVGGVRYGHVIDPRTGWPTSGVLSATVITTDAASADALSTAFLIGGLDLARRYCAVHRSTLAILVLDDNPERLVRVGRHGGVTLQDDEKVRSSK